MSLAILLVRRKGKPENTRETRKNQKPFAVTSEGLLTHVLLTIEFNLLMASGG
jgi:hypothetical protein